MTEMNAKGVIQHYSIKYSLFLAEYIQDTGEGKLHTFHKSQHIDNRCSPSF